MLGMAGRNYIWCLSKTLPRDPGEMQGGVTYWMTERVLRYKGFMRQRENRNWR